ncbi:MAG: lysophospholipid acyltransferase family protein [Mariprofundaceae bacterium]
MKLSDWLIPKLIFIIHKCLIITISWEFVGQSFRKEEAEPFLLSFWHARGLMMPYAFRHWHGYVLMSEHRDGGFISDAVNLMGVQTIRGSSTRGGAKAILQMIRRAKEEKCGLGITPDGPKGPREKVKPGIVQIAAKSSLPILPVCYAASRYWRAKSWDQFYIPKPFSRGVFIFGEKIDLQDDEPIDDALERIQRAMDHVQEQADHHFQ